MPRSPVLCAILLCALGASPLVFAEAAAPLISPAGTLVTVPAFGSVKQVNDQATVFFSVEEQDKDKSAAASLVNRKMKEGIALIRRADPQAVLRTRGYHTYPVYPEERVLPAGMPPKPRVATAWRVGQTLEVTTVNVRDLAAMAAAAQKVLALTGVQFSLTEAAVRKLDEQRIAATYQNLTERIAAIARAMGRHPADAHLESIDFDGTYNAPVARVASMAMAREMKSAEVEENSFEPGETTLQMQLVGKVRFK